MAQDSKATVGNCVSQSSNKKDLNPGNEIELTELMKQANLESSQFQTRGKCQGI